MRRAGLAAIVALLGVASVPWAGALPGGGAGTLAAQAGGGADEASLRSAVASIARSWQRGDAGGVVAQVAEEGVRLQLPGGGSSPLSQRRAAAVLRRLLGDGDGASASAGMVGVVEGSPPRGFGELVWESRADGTPGPQRRVVYLGFTMEDGRWRLTEIRLLG